MIDENQSIQRQRNEHAVALGALGCRKGGLVKSEAKAISSRANGKLGGRPKKQPIIEQ